MAEIERQVKTRQSLDDEILGALIQEAGYALGDSNNKVAVEATCAIIQRVFADNPHAILEMLSKAGLGDIVDEILRISVQNYSG